MKHAGTDKKSFILYTDSYQQLAKLSDAKLGLLMRCIFDYQIMGTYETNDPIVDFAMAGLVAQFDRDSSKWLETKEKLSKAGRKGGLARASKAKQGKAIQAVSVSVSDSVSDSVSENKKRGEKKKRASKSEIADILDPIPESRRKLIDTWLKYKAERNERYKPTGLKSFIKKWSTVSNADFEKMIEKSMASNYSGVFELRPEEKEPERKLKKTQSV